MPVSGLHLREGNSIFYRRSELGQRPQLEALQQRYELPDDLELLDGGTTGMGLLDDIGRCAHLLVLDAVQTGDPPESRPGTT